MLSFLPLRVHWPTAISSKGRASHNSFNLGVDHSGDLKLIRRVVKLRGTADQHLIISQVMSSCLGPGSDSDSQADSQVFSLNWLKYQTGIWHSLILTCPALTLSHQIVIATVRYPEDVAIGGLCTVDLASPD